MSRDRFGQSFKNRKLSSAAADTAAGRQGGLEAFPTRPARFPFTCSRCKKRFPAGAGVLILTKGMYWCEACCAPR